MKLQPNKVVCLALELTFIAALGVFAAWTWSYLDHLSTQASTQPINISVEKQDDSPLLISSPFLSSTDSYKPKYGFSLTNISDKSISAYAIKYNVISGSNNVEEGETNLANLSSLSSILKPGFFKQETNAGNSIYSEGVKEIILSIDFVEFTDGATWGADTGSSAEYLAGQRAGGKTALKYFREKSKSVEFSSFLDVDTKDINLQPPDSNASSIWQNGFRSGVGVVRYRLKKARDKNNLESEKQELEKPFDVTDGRVNND